MIDDLGDQMKGLERASAGTVIPPELPIYVRIDGRGFSRFTKGMHRPFDTRMTSAMQKTTHHLMASLNASAAYTQSDEISLIWAPRPDGEHLFGGKPQKFTSVLASLAAAAFMKALVDDKDDLSKWINRLPHFDARVVAMPSISDAVAMLAWRGQDAKRNGLNQIARSIFSHKEMQGKSTQQVRQMLADSAEFRPTEIPARAVNGSLFHQVTSRRTLSEAERNNIPEKHRPGPSDLFDRTAIEVYSQTHPGNISNLSEVIFDKSRPEYRKALKTGVDS